MNKADRNYSRPPETSNGTHVVLICRAPHPRGARGDSRFQGRLCGKRLQAVPFRVRPTYRAVSEWNDASAGCIVVRCLARDCRAFTEYRIIGDVPLADAQPTDARGTRTDAGSGIATQASPHSPATTTRVAALRRLHVSCRFGPDGPEAGSTPSTPDQESFR